MGHFTEKLAAKLACRASKKAMGSNNTCFPGNYEGVFNRVFSYKGVDYRFLVHKEGCPAGMVDNGSNECISENTNAALNAGAPACSAGNSVRAGNPIHVGTGNKYQHEIDLESSGPGSTLGFSRHYNSRPANLGSGQ